MFDTSTNTAEQRAIIDSAVARCSFRFDQLAPKLTADTGRKQVPVTWEDLSAFGARALPGVAAAVTEEGTRQHGGDHRRATLGLFYYSGRIVVERGLVSRPELAAEVFLAEAAHAVDRFFLTPDMRRAIWQVWHPGGQTAHHDTVHGWTVPFSEWTGEMDQPGSAEVGYFDSGIEGWMSSFTRAFAPSVQVTMEASFAHRTTPDMAARIRDIVQPAPAPEPQPEPQPEPVPDPFYAARWGVAFHRADLGHWWVPRYRTFPTRDAACDAGLRPCKLCQP